MHCSIRKSLVRSTSRPSAHEIQQGAIRNVSEAARSRTTDEAADYSHPVRGERAGFVGTDCRRVTHCLARVQVTHQVVVFHHSLSQPHVPGY